MAKKAKHLEKYQFKPGQSGNPAGRRQGSTLTDCLRREFAKVVAVKGSDGKPVLDEQGNPLRIERTEHLANWIARTAMDSTAHPTIQGKCLEAVLARIDPLAKTQVLAAAPIQVIVVQENEHGQPMFDVTPLLAGDGPIDVQVDSPQDA